MSDFNPNGAAIEGSGIFGLPFDVHESELVILPIPWEATCSYGSGCSEAPNHVFEASKFVELYDEIFQDFYMKGIGYIEPDLELHALSMRGKVLANPIIELAGEIEKNEELKKKKKEIDNLCEIMNKFVFDNVIELKKRNKIVGVLGGDHSVALGSIKAHFETYPNMGVLQIDAHADLRDSFENLKYSHASVMHNVITNIDLSTLVQVGVRGYCEEELKRINDSNGRIKTFFDQKITEQMNTGNSWDTICETIISNLPDEVYISFDIDGLDQTNCPNTGTPMPGGLNYNQALFLINKVRSSGRKIIGFDLVEVSCGDMKSESWDAIMAANLLYRLCSLTLHS